MIKNNILPDEQRGFASNSYGSKDQLIINKTIIEDCKKKKKKNLSIDYKKAFDSVSSYNRRVRLILRTELDGRNKMEAINSLAVPLV